MWFVLGHSGQRKSVKCAEAAWNYKAGGIVHLKSPAVSDLTNTMHAESMFRDVQKMGKSVQKCTRMCRNE